MNEVTIPASEFISLVNRVTNLEVALIRIMTKIEELLPTAEESSALEVTDKDSLIVEDLRKQLEKYQAALKRISDSWVLNSSRLIEIAREALE